MGTIENAKLEPTLAVSLANTWMALNLKFISDYKLRKVTKHQLFQHIEQTVSKTNGKVKLASATLQLLKIPELKVILNK